MCQLVCLFDTLSGHTHSKSVYFLFAGFLGENDLPICGCTIAVKTHGYCLTELPSSR